MCKYILGVLRQHGRSDTLAKLKTLLLSVMLSFSAGVSADDTELFFSSESAPANLLFIVDSSDSMGNIDNPADGLTRLEKLQSAFELLLEDLDGVNVGIIDYDRVPTLNVAVDDVDEVQKEALLAASNALVASDGAGTQAALWHARDYLRGQLASPTAVYPSPITHECQQNHIILLTSGQPAEELNNAAEVEADLGIDCLADGDPLVNLSGGECGREIGAHLATADHSSDIPGTSSVVTHTIGFNSDHPWLASISSEGGGSHFEVDSTADVLSALQSIVDGVGTTFASPTVSVNSFNESRHRSELYYSQFLSSNSVRWDGNIKKYKLSEVTDEVTGETETLIVDAEDRPLIDNAGRIIPATRSLWSDTDDGSAIPRGGFAAELPSFIDRNWYTDFNSDEPVKIEFSDINSTLDTKLPAAALGADGDVERDKLVSWVLGRDVEGFDLGAANDEINHYVGDSLHNSPLFASYSTESNTGEFGEILFAANNLGMLHAIDPEFGTELWSFMPEEHLSNIKAYFDNAQSSNHVYGLDGEFTLHTTVAERDGYDFWVDTAWLYLTERRGGNRVYGLDVTNGLDDRGGANPFSVMWKITGGVDGTPVYDKDSDGVNDFADLGQTWSKPQMVSLTFNCPDDCETKDLLMFAGGYNPDIYDDVDLDYSAITVPGDSHGNAVYFVDPQSGELAWSVGNGTHHSLNLPMNHSVPSTPVPIDTDMDGSIDLMYFVDVAGDVWRVDFDATGTNLNEAHVAGGKIAELSPVGQSLRFFNPIDVVVSGTSASTAFFSLITGSGMRARPLFQEPNPNRLYTIIDRSVREAPFRLDEDGNEVFDYRYVTDASGNHSVIRPGDSVLRNTSDTSSTTSTQHGFFRTFQLGEKILQPTLVTNNLILANSFVPPATLGGDVCNFDIGQTRLYISSLANGENSVPIGFGGEFIEIGEGLLGSGQIIDTGNVDAPLLLIDKNVFTLKEITVPKDHEVFRRFRRTGWVNLDE